MSNVVNMIDHTLLKPDATKDQIETLCKEAKEFHFAAVCVNLMWVELCAKLLKDSNVKVACAVGFPLGATSTSVKAFEANAAIENGASEIDMVINIGALKDRNYNLVEEDIRRVVDIVSGKAIVKVIIETALLTDEEKVKACELSVNAGAHFVKTSTGFSGGGATREDVQLMRGVVGDQLGVKASGGIRDKETAVNMIEAGANRIGASSGVSIAKGEKGNSLY